MNDTKQKLTHVDEHGAMRMVDVGDKPSTRRWAIAEAVVRINDAGLAALRQGTQKGDAMAAARLAGIQAAKKTSDLIPLCHPLALTHVSIDLEILDDRVRVRSRTETTGPTGVEMEATVAASVAALTLYDMLKAIDRGIIIEAVQLLEKGGGRSGLWQRR